MTHRKVEALLAIGSDLDPDANVPRALDLLRRRFEVVAVSPSYRTPAVGGSGPRPDFVNLAVRIRTDCPPRALREACRRIEDACGRRRTADRDAPRTLDVDIAMLGDLVADLGGWRIPDPHLATRAHVLVPCADVAPEILHPVTGRTLAAMCAAFPPSERARMAGTTRPVGPPASDPGPR